MAPRGRAAAAPNPKLEFNKHRTVLLSNIPPSTEGEIREFLAGFKTKKIKISESLDSALVTLDNGDKVDEAVQKLNGKQFKDNTVTVKPGFSNQLLCIAHLPLSYTDAQFKELCGKYGTVDYCYIMRAEKGESKGYGLVEYVGDLEQVKSIKNELDWMSLDGQTLHADFVDEAHQSWDGLQSRCLLINSMPEDFVDVSKLREMFGVVTSPVYCQIIAKGEKSLGYGIVEFRTLEDAEQTWAKLKNEKIEEKEVVLTFCIPGKSAVVINNRIMWKFGDKLQKSSSLLPDPVSAKPVIAGNPIVISLTKLNPKLMDEFTNILGELQQAYVSQMMSPVNKPGLLGPAPSLPLSPMMNPNMQLGLLVMLALHIQAAKKEQFTGVLAKQLNTLSEQDGDAGKSGPKPSILGDPMTGQANVILTSLKQQLNQVPLTGEDGKELTEPTTQEEKVKLIVKKFVANGRYLNLSLLSQLGQLLVTMKQGEVANRGSGKGQSLLGPVPGSLPQPLMGTPFGAGAGAGAGAGGPALGGKGNSLLGDPPNVPPQPLMNSANANINSSIMQAMGLNVGSGNSMGSMGQSLLSQISQGLVHQIGQNILYQMSVNPNSAGGGGGGGSGGTGSGRGLLGDVPSDGGPRKKTPTAGKSLLGEPPSHLKSGPASGTNTPLDQGTWKSMETRWGSGAYESGYGNKGGMGGGYNDYGGYTTESYGDMGGRGGAGGGGYGGYGDGGADFYNYQSQYGYGAQADNVYQTESGYNSQFGSGFGSGSGMGGGGQMGSGGGGFGMGGGLGVNQASGVNFQDGQGFGKGGSVGLGQDSGKYMGDGYGTGMGGTGYGYGGGRDDLGNGYDSYGSVGASYSTGMGDTMGTGMGGGMGGSMGGGMGGGMGSGGMSGGMGAGMGSSMGGGGMSGSMGGGMGGGSMGGNMGSGSMGGRGMGGGMSSVMGGGMTSGMGGGMTSGMGGGMSSGMGGGMTSGMGGGMSSGMGGGMTSGMGGGMGGASDMGMGGGLLSSSGMSGMGGLSAMGGGMGSSGMGGNINNGLMGSSVDDGVYNTSMGSSSRSGMGGGAGAGLLGSGGGSFGGSMASGSGMGSKMGGMSNRESAAYFTGGISAESGTSGSGLLPSPSKSLMPAGQKRGHSQFLPQPEASPEPSYIGQHSQGLGGHYVDTFKRSRLF